MAGDGYCYHVDGPVIAGARSPPPAPMARKEIWVGVAGIFVRLRCLHCRAGGVLVVVVAAFVCQGCALLVAVAASLRF